MFATASPKLKQKIPKITVYRIYSRIGRNFFLIFFVQKLGCDLYGGHTWVKISTKSKQKQNLSAIACMHSCTHIPKQPMAQGHAPVITANAIKPRCLLHMQHYSKYTGA